MGDVRKLADSGIHASQRYQIFDSSDTTTAGLPVAQGDVLRLRDSLMRTSGRIVIETSAGCDLGIKINSRTMVYPRADSLGNAIPYMGGIEGAIPVLSQGVERTTENPEITVGAMAYWDFQGSVDDVEITTWTAGTWELRAF